MNPINSHILKLISNYLSKEITEKEFNELKQWLNENPKNEQFFIDHLKLYKKARRVQFADILDKDVAWDKVVSKLKQPLHKIESNNKQASKVKHLKLTQTVLKYAAILILFISLGYIYRSNFLNTSKNIVIPAESITLQLENGNIQIINEDGSNRIVDSKGNIVGKQNGSQLVYSNNTKKENLVYNTLKVPYGKRFEIQLSDGTKVQLNAGTSLKYPVSFLKGQNREVFLVGEAFFSVAKDKKHPFIVNTENLNIEVLGTEFNVSSYPEDSNSDVVLVEGSVGMYTDNKSLKESTILTPGIKGSLSKKSQNIKTEKVNTLIYTSWRQGGLFFRNMTFKNIAKKLERQYNIKIIIENKLLENEIFNANFNEEPIENILSYLNDSYNIEYTIRDNVITIK